MTAQIRDLLEYNEEKMVLSDEPLKEYIKSRDDIDFIFKSTAWWRGYVCKWEIRDKKLYLIYLLGFIEGNKQVDLSYVFPGKKERPRVGSAVLPLSPCVVFEYCALLSFPHLEICFSTQSEQR